MTQTSTQTETSLSIRRTIKAPRQKVFDAWTQPQHIRNWWRCDPSWSTVVAEIDLRVGGRYRFGMRDPAKDHDHVVSGEFIEVDAPNRLVYTWAWEEPTEHPGQSRVTVEFIENGNTTDLLVTHDGFPELSYTEAHNQGWQACLNVFEGYIL